MDDVANLNNVIDDLLPSMILHLEHLRKRQQQQTEKIPAAPDCNPSPTAQQQQSPCAPAAHEDDVLLIDFSWFDLRCPLILAPHVKPTGVY